jgi:hypothetical protein
VGSQSFGDQEGNPATVVAVRTSDQVARVTLHLGDQTDSMTPVNGYAVLAVPSTAAGLPAGTISGYGSDGAQLAQVSTADQGSSFGGGPDCQPPAPPPPTLPQPDGPPPVDQDAAKAAIEDAYHQVFGGGALDSVEGGDQLQTTADAAKAKNPIPPALSSTVHDIRFINDHRAALTWDLLSNGNALLANQIGYAVLVDGKWKVARETECALLKMGGADCP